MLNNPLKYTDPSGWLLTKIQIEEEKKRIQRAAEQQGEISRGMTESSPPIADGNAQQSGISKDGSSSWVGRLFHNIGSFLGIITPDLPGIVLDEVAIQGKARSAQGNDVDAIDVVD